MTNECLVVLTKSAPPLLLSSKVFFRFLTACLRQELPAPLPWRESWESNDLVEGFLDFEEETGG